MNRKQKGFIGLIMAFVLLSMSSGHIAAFNVTEEIITQTSADVSSYSRILTRQEATQRLMQAENISPIEAEAILDEAELQANKLTQNSTEGEKSGIAATSSTYYTDYIVNNDFGGGFTGEAGCLLLITRYGSGHEYINAIISDWTIASGFGNYTWKEAYCISELQNARRVYLRARGAIELAVDQSTQGGAESGSELVGAGFSVSSTVGSTYYYRKLSSWDGTYVHPII